MSEVKNILEDLGYTLYDRGSFFQSCALWRGGDNPTALQIYKDTGCWKDHVEDSPFMPFKALIQKTLNTKNDKEISRYLNGEVQLDKKDYNKEKITMEKVYNDNVLERLLPHYSFYLKKGISEKILTSLKCGLATNGKMYNRLVFPIYNQNNNIHGFAGRIVTPNSNAPKWKILGKKTSFIYPYFTSDGSGQLVKDSIEKNRSVVIVESVGDCLSCLNNGLDNLLVSFGISISPKLICHLMSLDIDEIIISFNNDCDKDKNVGLDSSIKAYLKLLNHFSSDKIKICLPLKNDFGEMTEKKDFNEWRDKLKNLDIENHKKNIIKRVGDMKNKGDISETLFKNLKKI